MTFTFSEKVDQASFTAVAENGDLSTLTWADDGLSATATFTATDGVSGTGSFFLRLWRPDAVKRPLL